MSRLMSHDEYTAYPDVPKTNEGFLYNEGGYLSLNSLGHRCKEIKEVLGEDLQFQRYFLVLGDNACLHMHKPLEETWPYLLSKTINHQYYNLAVSDTGLEGVKYNLFNWLHQYSKPKMIFISCEWANRFIGVDYADPNIIEASYRADGAGFWIGRRRLFTKLVENLGIPVYLILGPKDEHALHENERHVLADSVKILEVDHSDDAKVAEIVSEGFLKTHKVVSP